MIPLGDWSKQPLATEPHPFHPSDTWLAVR